MSRVEFLSLESLLEMKANDDKFKLVEVLSKEEYKEGHIPRAINIPLKNWRQQLLNNSRKRTI